MRTRYKNILLLSFLGALSMGSMGFVYAAAYYDIAPGWWQQVNEWGVCRRVVNDNALTVFMPTNTNAEWSAYYNNGGPSLTARGCQSCNPLRSTRLIVDGGGGCVQMEKAEIFEVEACATRCDQLGATGCSLIMGSGDGGCYSWSGAGCAYGSHGLWYGALCTAGTSGN
jgi:hypothetical protein